MTEAGGTCKERHQISGKTQHWQGRIRTQTQLVVVSCAKFNKVAEYRTMKVELQTQPGDITCWESAVVVVEHNELFPASTWVWREDNQSSRKVARAYTHPFWPCGCGLAAQLDRDCPRPNPCYYFWLDPDLNCAEKSTQLGEASLSLMFCEPEPQSFFIPRGPPPISI
jgi:hypothetical protein